MWGSRPPSNTWFFLGPIRVDSTSSISIGSAVFAGLTIVSDRQTDGHIYLHSTLMWPNDYERLHLISGTVVGEPA